MLAVKKERPTRGEPINIPDFMLSPRQKKRKDKKRKLMDNISFYTGVFFAIWFCWFGMYQDTDWRVAYIGMIASALLVVATVVWRRKHGFGGDNDDMDRGV